MNAFEGLLQDNSFPFYVLFIEIDPKHIDVNVHPTKTEIKFDDERAVYAVVRSAVKQALGAHNLTPAIDFQADVNLINKLKSPQTLTNQQYYEEQFGNSLQRSNLERWEKLFEEEESTSRLFHQSEPDQKVTLRFESAINREAGPAADERIAFQLHEKYIVRSVKNGLMIIDQQGAHERVLFDKFMSQLQGHPGGSQQSLFPQTVDFSPADFALVMEMEEEIKTLGFRFEAFGKNTLLISGIPAGTTGGEKELFEGLIEQFKKNQAELTLPPRENLACSLAKRAGIKSGQKLGKEEIEALVSGLFACHTPNFTPEGDTTFFIFDTSKIESYFRR
jgi:DNA mismatch repair protein MutL